MHRLRALDEADRDLLGLGGVELWRLAQNAEHGDAIAADLGVEIRQPVDRSLVDAAVVVERCRRDREGAFGLGGEFCHCVSDLLRHSGFDAAHRPGTTVF